MKLVTQGSAAVPQPLQIPCAYVLLNASRSSAPPIRLDLSKKQGSIHNGRFLKSEPISYHCFTQQTIKFLEVLKTTHIRIRHFVEVQSKAS